MTSSSPTMLIFLLLFGLLPHWGLAARQKPQHQPRLPMICNNGTDHQCVCGPEEPASDTPITCEHFIQTRELPVVDMRARHVNLEAQLHTNENYESYFKRRIAQIVSAYCERQVNECPGVTLRLHKGEDAQVDEDKSIIYATDENEPLLTQRNVVLLRVDHEPGNVTRVLFVITKSDKVISLSDSDIIDPVKVKVILGSQAVPLSRILGGIKLESVRVSRIRRDVRASENDNSKLKMMVAIVATFFIICYIIGAIKLYREWRERQEKRRALEGLAAASAVPNYGTLPKEQQPKPAVNGSAHHRTPPPPQQYYNQYEKIDETLEKVEDEPPSVLSDRQARFMFMCDSSQLPREPTFDSQVGLGESITMSTPPREERIVEEREHEKEPKFEDSYKKEPSPTPHNDQMPTSEHYQNHQSSWDTPNEHEPTFEQYHKDQPSFESYPQQESNWEPRNDYEPTFERASEPYRDDFIELKEEERRPPVAPAVVLIPSLSMQADTPLPDLDSPLDESPENAPGELLKGASPPPDRPRSRRGSRVDEEEIDLTEIGRPHPLPVPEQPLFTDLVIPDHIQADDRALLADAERWSSSDEEVDLYYKMSDEEDIKGDNWTEEAKGQKTAEAEEDSEPENEEDHPNKELESDAFVYERLREDASPMPPRVDSDSDNDLL